MQVMTQGMDARRFESQHKGCFQGEEIAYKAVTEEIILDGNMGKPAGSMFSYAYLRTDEGQNGTRPVIFAYNGGPGSGCVWLHLGFFGPRRVKIDDEVNPSPVAPFALEDNPYCLLPQCDIVLMDPVGCGYGRLLEPDASASFFGLEGDADAAATFIEWWLEKYDRRNSPVYLAGESYGTMRTCMLLRELCGGPLSARHRLCAIPVSGVILMGTVLEGTAGIPETFRPPQTALLLPSMAAVHWYHHLRETTISLKDWVEEAWKFAGNAYLTGWFAGEGLEKAAAGALMGQLEHYTGIPCGWWQEHHMEISAQEFGRMVLSGEGLDAGMYDGRYTMKHLADNIPADPVGDDPAMGKYTALFCTAQTLWKKEMELELKEAYRPIDFMVNGMWDYKGLVTPVQALQEAMRRNEKMRILFCSGLMDLVTPPGSVRFLSQHLGIGRERMRVKEYASGHMPYLGERSAAQLAEDIGSFIREED